MWQNIITNIKLNPPEHCQTAFNSSYILYNLSMDSLPKLPHDETLHISAEGLHSIIQSFDPACPERNFLWTTDFRRELPIRIKKSGPGSELPLTFNQLWKHSLEKFADRSALNFEKSPGNWETLTYRQYYNECTNFAKGLISLGIANNTTVNIIGFNSPAWAIAYSGSIFGNYVPVGIYTTNGPEACEYIANHSECQVVVLEDRSHLKKYISVKDKIPRVRYFILYNDTVPTDLDSDFIGKVLTWSQLMELGKKEYRPSRKEDQLEARMTMAKPGNCCTFIYTSGTTGPPKAVMLSHDSVTWVVEAVGKRFGFDKPEKQGTGRMLSMLPLSHIAAQLTDLVITLKYGFGVFFTDPSALQGNLVKFLLVARPTFLMCVPRVWEKIEERITAVGAQTTGVKRKLADWAKAKSPQGTYHELTGKGSEPSMWKVCKKLVFDKIKENLGLDKCEIFMSGAAPLRESTKAFFINLNIFIYNVYGMSELAGPETFTQPEIWGNFTSEAFLKEAGTAIQGCEVSINTPDSEGNGEICLRGRNNFMGYFKNEEETRATVDSKGFVHSGDVGVLDKHNCLSVTGRIKELIITAGGQNVAPVLIENEVITNLPIFSSVVVVGDKRKYLVALLFMRFKDPVNLDDEVVEYLNKRGSKAATIQQVMGCPVAHKLIEDGVQKANSRAISKAQRIVKFKIMPTELSIDSGTLTPTLKLRRKIISELFTAEIESLYIDAKL